MVAISNYYVGVNIGSVSVNLVSVDEKGKYSIAKESHVGKPQEVLDKLLKENRIIDPQTAMERIKNLELSVNILKSKEK